MNILFYPKPSDINAYYKILKKYCEEKNIGVFGITGFNSYKVFKCGIQCKIIHINWTSSIENSYLNILKFFLIILLFKLLGKKIIWTVHNYYPHEGCNIQRSNFFKQGLILLSSNVYSHSKLFSEEIKKNFYISNSKLQTIFHPTFEIIHLNNKTKELCLNKLNIEDNKKIRILFFGYIRKYKGLQDLIKALELVKNKNIQLMVVGSKDFYWENEEEKKELLNKIENNKKIYKCFHFINDEDVQIYLNACNVMIIPYCRYDTSGVAMLSLTFGKPAIIKKSAFTNDFEPVSPFITYENENQLVEILENINHDIIEKKQGNLEKIKNNYSNSNFFSILDNIYS